MSETATTLTEQLLPQHTGIFPFDQAPIPRSELSIPEDNISNNDSYTSQAIDEATHAIDALTNQLAKTTEKIRNSKVATALSVAAIALPGVLVNTGSAAAKEKNPVAFSSHEQESQTGGYPWAYDDPETAMDTWGYNVRYCNPYVFWKLSTLGIPSTRFINPNNQIKSNLGEWAALAQAQGDVVDQTPAAGAVAVVPNASSTGHVMYVEAVDGSTVTFSEYNGKRPFAYSKWSITIEQMQEMSLSHPYYQNMSYIHFEIPNPRFPTQPMPEQPTLTPGEQFFVDYEQDKNNKNGVNTRNRLSRGDYIESTNKRYRLVFQNDSNITIRDRKKDYAQTWQSGTKGKAGRELKILKPKKGEKGLKAISNRLVMNNASGKPVKTWYIGPADKVRLNDDGTFSGLNSKGGKIWTEGKLPGTPTAAKKATLRAKASKATK